MRDAVLVLGMHRSGTSAVAGALMKLGGAAPQTPMAPNAWNEKGHFESNKLMAFHDELLASAGSTWDDWRAFNPGWTATSTADAFRSRAAELFRAEFDEAPLPVLKDPRACRFAPFWPEVLRKLDYTPRIVIPVRSPLDVASSLKRRDGFPLTKGLLLWLRHCVEAEAETRSEARSIALWQDFASGWRRACDKVAADIQISWPRLSDRSALEIDEFLSPSLIHHETGLDSLRANPEVHDWTVRAYEALIELSKNPLSNSALATLDRIRTLLDDSSALFGRLLIAYEVEIERLQGETRGRAGDSDGLRARHDALAAARDAAENALTARAADFERALADADRERAALSEAADAARAERDALADEGRRLGAELAETRTRLVAESARASENEAALIRAGNETEALSAALAATRSERDELAEERSGVLASLDERERASGELSARAAELERSLGEAARAKEELSRARDALAEERDRLAAELGASRLEASGLSDRAAELERALGEAACEKRELLNASAGSAERLNPGLATTP